MTITVLNNQSILDIAIQHTGSVENAFKIAVANGLSMTDDLTPGQILQLPEDISVNREILEYYRAKKVQPATGFTKILDVLVNIVQRGIGYMQIGKTFKVS